MSIHRCHALADRIGALLHLLGGQIVFGDKALQHFCVDRHRPQWSDKFVCSEVGKLFEIGVRSSELVATLQRKAEIVETEPERIAIHARIAKLFIEKFRNQAEAIKAYETVLELDPNHGDANTYLVEMYEKRREWQKLIDLRRARIDQLDDDARVEELKGIATLASDKLRKPEVAAELWLDVRQHAPADRDALNALEKLYEKNKNFEALGDIYLAKSEVVDDPAESMKLLQKMGVLYSDRLGDSGKAIDA